MYSKQEVSQYRQQFWTAFGKYMSPIPSAEGIKTNWINYKTGVKHVCFRMQAGKESATISIELTHQDEAVRRRVFDQFKQLKQELHTVMGEEWEWQFYATDDNGTELSKIFKNIEGVNLFNKDDWPGLISFFKRRLIALDQFWSLAKYTFEDLK